MDKTKTDRPDPATDVTYPADKQDERAEPAGTGHSKPKQSDAPSSTVSTDVGKKNRETPMNDRTNPRD